MTSLADDQPLTSTARARLNLLHIYNTACEYLEKGEVKSAFQLFSQGERGREVGGVGLGVGGLRWGWMLKILIIEGCG